MRTSFGIRDEVRAIPVRAALRSSSSGAHHEETKDDKSIAFARGEIGRRSDASLDMRNPARAVRPDLTAAATSMPMIVTPLRRHDSDGPSHRRVLASPCSRVRSFRNEPASLPYLTIRLRIQHSPCAMIPLRSHANPSPICGTRPSGAPRPRNTAPFDEKPRTRLR